MDSANVFAANWSSVLPIVIIVGLGGVAILGLVAMRRLAPPRRYSIFAVLVVGAVAVGLAIPLPEYVGEPRALYRMRGAAGERLVVLTHFVHGRSAKSSDDEHNYLLTFELPSYREIGRLQLPAPAPALNPQVDIRGWHGRYAWLSAPEGYWIVDAAAAKLVARARDPESLVRAREVLGFDPATWASALLRGSPSPAAPPREDVRVERLQGPDGCVRADLVKPLELLSRQIGSENLVELARRALEVRPARPPGEACRIGVGRDAVWLVLGQRGRSKRPTTLLTALSDEQRPRWTLEIPARPSDVEILQVEPLGERLRLLVGARQTIFAYEVLREDGRVLTQRALY